VKRGSAALAELWPNTEGMVPIPAAEFLMGSDRHYIEERPVRRVAVEGLLIDRTPVTVVAFARFVAETVYVTPVESASDPRDWKR
jgi:formylglycine-generating enzyme required for sulfatase activity